MKALIFAAGLGTRLKPFTLQHPKALVPVCGKPMLRRVIEKLLDAGISEIVVNVHHFATQIIEYLDENNNFGANIHISDESARLLDTGGGILKARRWLDDGPFIVHNADILTDFPISEMIAAHTGSGADATLLVKRRQTSRYLLFDCRNRMRGWENITTSEVRPSGLIVDNLDRFAFGGVHILNPSVFPILERYSSRTGEEVFSVTPFYVSSCGQLDIRGYAPSKPYSWHDVGNAESLAEAEATFGRLL